MAWRRVGLLVLLALAFGALLLVLKTAPGPQPSGPVPEPQEATVTTPGKGTGTGAETRPPALEDVLTFAAPGDCRLAEPLASIIERMVRIDPETESSRRGDPIVVPGFDRPVTPTFERVREIEGNADLRTVTAELDLPGTWHGLRVVRLRREFMEESDVSAIEIDFDEPAERVREVLNRQGFRLPALGETRGTGPNEGIQPELGVDRREGGGATLGCWT